MFAPVFIMATLYGHSVTGSAGITLYNGHCQQNIILYRPPRASGGRKMSKNTFPFLYSWVLAFSSKRNLLIGAKISVFLSDFIVTLKEIATPGVCEASGGPSWCRAR